MSQIVILTLFAAAVGFFWGYRKPAGYCRMSKDEQLGFGNRFNSGLINAGVLGGLVFIISMIAFG